MTNGTRLALLDVHGPLSDLLAKLNGEGGDAWLKALKSFLRREDPWKVFDTRSCPSIQLGEKPRTVDDLRKLLEQHDITISSRASALMNSHDFTVASRRTELDFVVVCGRTFGLASSFRLKTLFDYARAFGFKVCPAEAAVALRARWMAQPSGIPVTIAMNSISDSESKQCMFVLYVPENSGPRLDTRVLYDDSLIESDESFAFVSRKISSSPILWETLPLEELKRELRRIANRTHSDNEFRDAVVEELEYPYSKEGIAVHSLRRGSDVMLMAMLHHESGVVSI